jgi:hypothetical protein
MPGKHIVQVRPCSALLCGSGLWLHRLRDPLVFVLVLVATQVKAHRMHSAPKIRVAKKGLCSRRSLLRYSVLFEVSCLTWPVLTLAALLVLRMGKLALAACLILLAGRYSPCRPRFAASLLSQL